MTAFDLRISYWSSYVCSSDLHDRVERGDLRSRRTIGVARIERRHFADRIGQVLDLLAGDTGRERHVALVNVQPVADAVEDRGEGIGILAAEPGVGVLQYGEQVTVDRSEEHTSELQSLMRIQYDVSCLN